MRASLQTGSSRELGFSCLRRQFRAGHSSVTPVSGPKLPCSSPCLQGVGPGRQLARRKLRPRFNGSSSSNSTSSLHERLQPNLTSRLEAVA